MNINFSIEVMPHQVNSILTALAGVLGPKQKTEPEEVIEKAIKGVKLTADGSIVANVISTGKVEKPIEKAVETAKAEKPIEKAVETAKAEKPIEKAVETAKPKYTVESVRAKSKEVSGKRGVAFIRECLDEVGASSISAIEESKFEQFMNLLTA